MYEQKSNLGSILVAVLAIALILGGVFLLNQSFNSGRNKDLSATTTSSSASLLAIGRSSSTASLLAVTDSANSSDSSSDSESSNSSSSRDSSSNSSSSSQTSSNTSNSNSSTSSSSSKDSTLKVGEFTARAITPTAKGSNWEIIDCNLEKVVFCKAGFKFPFSTTGTIGKTYKFSGGSITDSSDGLAISGVSPKLID